jgi:hypothetical protein
MHITVLEYFSLIHCDAFREGAPGYVNTQLADSQNARVSLHASSCDLNL